MTGLVQTGQTMDDASFRMIAALAYQEIGLTLVEQKKSMIQSRLRHRLSELGLADFSSYCAHIRADEGLAERKHLVSALTTNVTHFFREKHHFESLESHLRDRQMALRAGGRLRIWSAGCSNGQETLSIAMIVLECLPDAAELNIRILGTDIDPKVIRYARRGVYSERQLNNIDAARRARFFRDDGGDAQNHYVVLPDLAKMIQYNELNLLNRWPMKRPFDFIFCRNVVIYFDWETQARLWPRFRDALVPNGLLFLGHSERISDASQFDFECVEQTTYRAAPSNN